MFTLLLLLLLADCLALMVVVLLQSGKGGGLAAGFGGAGTGMERMGSRQTATFLHNATKWLGGAFLVICFAISLLTVRGTRPRSLIESEMRGERQEAPAAEEPGTPTDLQDILGGEATGGQSPQGGASQDQSQPPDGQPVQPSLPSGGPAGTGAEDAPPPSE